MRGAAPVPIGPRTPGPPAGACSPASPRPPFCSRALPARRAPGFVIVRVPAASGAGARAGLGACSWPPCRERAARGGRGGAGAGLGILGAPARAREPGLAPHAGSARGRGVWCRAGGARGAGGGRGGARGGRGEEEAPAWFPAKRPYLSGHSLSLPGGRLGAGAPFRALPRGPGQDGTRGAGRGRALPASPAPRRPPRADAHAGLPMTGGRPADSVA